MFNVVGILKIYFSNVSLFLYDSLFIKYKIYSTVIAYGLDDLINFFRNIYILFLETYQNYLRKSFFLGGALRNHLLGTVILREKIPPPPDFCGNIYQIPSDGQKTIHYNSFKI